MTAPAAAPGTLSMSCSRLSCPARPARPTPSAASKACCRRRSRIEATTLTTKPTQASNPAAATITSSDTCGMFGSGSASSWAADPAQVTTLAPAGNPGGGPARPASHHWVTGSGGCDCAARAC